MTDKPIEDMSFEEAMAELEQVVSQLESGQTPLDQSIDLYERGAALRKKCEDRLKDAELRVQKIIAGADGKAKGAEPFDGA
ncbi:MAG: exodeoxyribonuclease VII small subunit [Pseudomonadota bacterium]